MRVDPSEFNDLTGQILGAAIEVHRALGAGLLESIYTSCLHFELSARNLRYVAQRAVPIVYKGMTVDARYRVDLIVEDRIVVEVKSVEALSSVHESQLLTCLALTELSSRSPDQFQRSQTHGWRQADAQHAQELRSSRVAR